MKHEKIYKRQDGSKVKVIAEFSVDAYRNNHSWGFSVEFCEPNKRTWRSPVDTDNYMWRKLSMEDRRKDNVRKFLELVSVSEVLETQNELYKMLGPTHSLQSMSIL